MCGIVGYVGKDRPATEVILNGLQMLEYRGYDSAGIVTSESGKFFLHRKPGKIRGLQSLLESEPLPGHCGIGHTRWATHGIPSESNAHPHIVDNVVIVHNGIIENFKELKQELLSHGRNFQSDTDSEVLAHYIALEYETNHVLREAVSKALKHIIGSYAIAVMATNVPQEIIVARQASPLVIGIGNGEHYAASDVPALLEYTKQFIYIEDGELARLTPDTLELFNSEGQPITRQIKTINWSPIMAQKEGHRHFMHKEIYEQPRAIADTLRGRLSQDNQTIKLDEFPVEQFNEENIDAITFLACGTSYHASLVGKHLCEALARLPASAELASEFRYNDPLIGKRHLVVAISQSGETADTLAAVEEAQSRGAKVLSITNVMESSLARKSNWTLYTHAGPEIGVASTKAFTTQLTLLYLIAFCAAKQRGNMSNENMIHFLTLLRHVPRLIEESLQNESYITQIAKDYTDVKGMLYLGRGISHPIALEGALKLKEISYIHAEGYPAGEMKHGPIALIEPNVPTVVIDAGDHTTEKLISNIQEIRARRGPVIVVSARKNQSLEESADHFLQATIQEPLLSPLLTTIPLQLFAYHIADHRGTDVDQPRNLAKSVTVE